MRRLLSLLVLLSVPTVASAQTACPTCQTVQPVGVVSPQPVAYAPQATLTTNVCNQSVVGVGLTNSYGITAVAPAYTPATVIQTVQPVALPFAVANYNYGVGSFAGTQRVVAVQNFGASHYGYGLGVGIGSGYGGVGFNSGFVGATPVINNPGFGLNLNLDLPRVGFGFNNGFVGMNNHFITPGFNRGFVGVNHGFVGVGHGFGHGGVGFVGHRR
jgi:hypothetical protein